MVEAYLQKNLLDSFSIDLRKEKTVKIHKIYTKFNKQYYIPIYSRTVASYNVIEKRKKQTY